MRITKVYTKGGDDGTTGLVGGTRVSKNHPRVCAVGTIDELNSVIGLARAELSSPDRTGNLPEESRTRTVDELGRLQNDLFAAGCDLGVPLESRWDGMPLVSSDHTKELEARIDTLTSMIPPLEEFVLPTGTPSAAALHLARTVCRRAEREALVVAESEPIGEAILPYLNRLSDYLFVLARWLTIESGEEETTWKH